jgi:hypothetical protein
MIVKPLATRREETATREYLKHSEREVFGRKPFLVLASDGLHVFITIF